MGTYTEIFVNVALKADTPAHVLQILNNPDDAVRLPDHPFFSCDRWDQILTGPCSGGSYYFNLNNFYHFRTIDDISKGAGLCLLQDLKNYDNEIDKFFDWIEPYVAGSDFERVHMGHHRYEESEEPTLRYRGVQA